MHTSQWNNGWLFWQEKDAFALVWSIPAEAKPVILPHDAMLENPARADSPNGGNTGYRDGGVYVYCKSFFAPEEWKNQTVALKFEGSYCNTSVFVNGQLAVRHASGYTGFLAELNEFLRYEAENEVRVFVRNVAPSSRWYSGSGLYRDVLLLTAPLAHITDEGVWAVTESLEEELAVVRVQTELSSRSPLTVPCTLETELLDPEGRTVAKVATPLTLASNGRVTVPQRMAVEHPRSWSAETPSLYTCRSRLILEDGGADEIETSIGIRTLSVDARRGLRVNGKTVKLLGGCIHQDHGLLGAATYEQAELRRMQKMKEAGFNAVRISHHPASPALLRACDRVGMYLMDEAFDMWTRAKTELDYSSSFSDHAREEVTALARSARSHPSVVLYSIGNEIPECATDLGARIGGELAAAIRQTDPTRPITAGINGVFMSGDAIGEILADILPSDQGGGESGNVNNFMTAMDTHLSEIVVHPAVTRRLDKACAFLDVAGYNYMTARYALDAARCPDRVMVGSETYPPAFAANWAEVQRLPQVIGDFTWTGWDYIGEAGVGIPAYHFGEGGFGAQFPCQLAYCGDIDITGFRRPASYYRQIAAGLWAAPYIAVQNPHHYGEPLLKTPWVISDSTHSWTWLGCEAKPVVVEVYASADEVELFCNGASLGVQKPVDCIARFETVYAPGALRAVARREGVALDEDLLETAGPVSGLTLSAEADAPAGELCWLQVGLTDAAGRLNPDEARILTVKAEGEAQLLAFGSADPKPGQYPVGTTRTFGGRAQIILRKTGGPCTVTVAADSGESAAITI